MYVCGLGDRLFMAVTGLEFSLSTIQQLNHDTAFILMDKRSIDLNKHAIDLNEVPMNDFSLDFYDASASHELGRSLLPKKGGWLELFRNMFGHDKVVLDGFPFASRSTTLNSSSSNNISQANGKVHSDPRINSTQAVHNSHSGNSVDQKLDMAKQSVPYGSKLASLPQQRKDNRTSKLPMFDEFNHGNIFNTLPISEHTGTSSKPFYNAASGQRGCQNDFLNPIYSTHKYANFSAGVGQQGCDALGQPRYSNGLHTSFNPISEQGSVGSSFSHGLNQYRAPLPLWDLNSQPVPNWSADLQPLAFSKAHMAGSHHFSQHPGKHSTAVQAHIMDNIEGACASLTNLRHENGLSEQEKDCKCLPTCLGKEGFMCSQKKSSSGSHRCRALESHNGDILPLDRGKGLEQRVRIIASPDWLPAGWITEVKTRMAGSTAGTTDKYYKDPVTGRRFRSKNEVLNFLQTGRLCRNKPLVKLLEGFPAVTNMPLLLPKQDQRVGLSDSFQATSAKHTSLTLATELSSQASICQSICPPSVILDRISVKQEQDDMVDIELQTGNRDYRFSDVTTLVETSTYNLEERPGLEMLEIEKFDTSIRAESTGGCMYREPVHSSKRKSIGDCNIRLPSKRFRSTVKDYLQDQDKWIFSMSPFPREAEAQAASTRVEAVDTRIAHNGYPGLLYKQETNESQDKAISQYLAARYRANARALGLYVTPLNSSTAQVNVGCAKDLQPGSLSKGGEKKAPKLTLKQERDLFITLGRKLCREFLAPTKDSCLQ